MMRTTLYSLVAVSIAFGGCASEPNHQSAVDAGTGPADDAAAPSGSDADAPTADGGASIADASPQIDGASSGPTTIQRTFRSLDWNIAGGKENNCNTPGITRAVVRYVENRDIDFVSLNEVCRSQFESIREALREPWGKGDAAKFAAYVGDGEPRIVGNAIYSRFDITDVTRHEVGKDRFGTRNLLCAATRRFPHLRFCSIHLSPADDKATRQLGRVHNRIERWWEENRDTVIWAGDLNLRPNQKPLNDIYSPNANHPQNNPNNSGNYRELDDADPKHCPGYGERSLPNTTGGPCKEGGKIDFIFVRENRIVGDQYFGNTLNIPQDCSGVCSDHRPVIGQAKVRIRQD